MKDPLNILCFGEAMQEYTTQDGQAKPSGFAGDVLNFCVYLKRCAPYATVKFCTAIGSDRKSDEMLNFIESEKIDTSLIARSQERTIGSYTIVTDASGERSFTYDRANSAARIFFDLTDSDLLEDALNTATHIYFSGITLAILTEENREALFDLLKRPKQANKIIIFDPNYRPKLWQNADLEISRRASLARDDKSLSSRAQPRDLSTIQRVYDQAYKLTNILLSNLDDEKQLFGEQTEQDIITRIKSYSFNEAVLTNGAESILLLTPDKQLSITPHPPKKIVDTTSAGDSFNASYIAAREKMKETEKAIIAASKLASQVIGQLGAITKLQ